MARQSEGAAKPTAAQLALAKLMQSFYPPPKPKPTKKKTSSKAKPKPPKKGPEVRVNPSTGAAYAPGRAATSAGRVNRNDREAPLPRRTAQPYKAPQIEASAANKGAQADARNMGSISRAIAATNAAGGASGGGSFLSGSYLPNTGGSASDYLSRAENMAGMEYDPKINELLRQQQGAVATQKASDAELKAMYAALAADMKAKQGEEKTRFGQEVAATNASTNQLAAGIGGTFNKSATDQVAQLKALGIEAAAPDILAKTGEQSSTLQGLAKLQGQSATGALNILGQGAQNRMSEFGAIAGTEGANRRADLQQLLLSRLGEWGGQIADLRGAKGKLAMELTDKYRNEDFDKQMALANLQLNTDKFTASNEQWAKDYGLRSEKAKLDAANAAAKGTGSAVEKLDAWQNLGLLAQDIEKRQSPNDPARKEDYLAIIKRMFDQYETDDYGHPTINGKPIGTAAEAGKAARSLNSKNALKGLKRSDGSAVHQVNSNFLNELAMEAYSRIIKGENYQYG